MLRRALLGAVLALLVGAPPGWAQQVESGAGRTEAPTASTVRLEDTAAPSQDTINGYADRLRAIRLHKRPTPLGELTADELAAARAAMPPPPPATPAPAAAGDRAVRTAALSVTLERNVGLPDTATAGITSLVGEPSVGARGTEVLLTGNWFAAFSTNGGSTFRYVDPGRSFPAVPGEDFCCDQLAFYNKKNDLMVWVLQYIHPTIQGTNRLRVAVAKGADIPRRAWRFYDFTPQGVGGWNSEWFDFPAIAASNGYLYITTNAFTFNPGARFTRAVALRLPLAALASYSALNYRYFNTTEFGSLRPVQGASSTMYFGTHLNAATLRVFEWPEASTSLSSRNVGVSLWAGGGYSAPGPDGANWVGRADPRVTAGWLTGGRLGFAWTAAGDATFPKPHVRVARINVAGWTLSDQPHIWNPGFAFAYPAAAPNTGGVVGVSLAYGGGSLHPSHTVGVRDDGASAWSLVTTRQGTHGPSSNVWGDYFTINRHGTKAGSWATTGFTLSGGRGGDSIVPRYVQFRAGSTAAGAAPESEAETAAATE